MSIAGELNTLVTTKAVQRRKLEAAFPYIDWDRMPFSCYVDFFALKNILDDCAAVWTNAYGRSNSEDASTRDILPDYSGNGRDIRLYNFAFEGMSGYGGYVCDFNDFNVSTGVTGLTLTKSAARVRIEVTEAFNYPNAINILSSLWDVTKGRTVKVTSTYTDIDSIQLQYSSQGTYQDIALNGKTFIPAYSGTVDNYMYIKLANVRSKAGVIDIELLPEYPGGLVSDGIDDYGQCVKDFALPDDYTVVAIRKRLREKGVDSSFAAKSSGVDKGAFLLENGSSDTYSYGQVTSNLGPFPPLFIYQTKTSYCGKTITSGTNTDTEDDILCLFRKRVNQASDYYKCALYDLGIFTRTLTDDELRVVKNCMMAEWAAMTGELDNITYVADWDAKGRSNDEEEPMRSQWIDKATGKVINLSNFAYAGMSGWGGYGTDMSKLVPHDDIAVTETAVTSLKCTSILQQSNSPIAEWGPNRIASGPTTVRFRVTGVSDNLGIRFESYTLEEGLKTLFTATGDGVYTAEISDPAKYYRWIAVTKDTTVYPVNCDITIEQLPLYPGALVCDGVDDYGVTREAVTEQVGTVLAMYRMLSLKDSWHYLLDTRNDTGADRLYIGGNSNTSLWVQTTIARFKPPTWPYDTALNIQSSVGSAAIAAPVMVFGSKVDSLQPENVALYRLILIEEQLDDTQQEFLKWKVDKEYRDWLIRMGFYEEEVQWYGVEWDVTDTSPDVKRIGNMEMHRTLPVQSQMRGCLLNDDGTVAKWLDGKDWTAETRDGSAGQSMVRVPVDGYWRFEADGNIRRVKLAVVKLPGFTRTPQGFVSAYQAAVQRSTGKLCSVVNTDTDYRGGNNEAEYDGTYCSKLGVPATNMTMAEFRTAARDRKPGSHEWNIMTYQFHKLLYWLFVVEYATRNTQKTFNADKDADGFAQGGLGAGVANLSDFSYANRMGCPFIPCGYTDALGNGTGQRAFTLPFEGDATASQSYAGEYSAETAYTAGQLVSQGEDLYLCTAAAEAGTPLTDTEHFSKKTRTVTQVPRYRGVENPFGHVWTAEDGLNVLASPDTEDGGDGLSRAFVCGDPRKFSDTDVTGYDYVGDMSREYNKNISDILFGSGGEIVAKETGGLSSQYFCDRTFAGIPSSRSVMKTSYGGAGNNRDGIAGLVCISTDEVRTSKSTRSGTRLCFIPEEHFED